MKDTEKVNYLYNKYKDKTEGMLHNSLWQILIEECRKGVQSAFTYLYVANKGVNVGIADLDESGYTPATFSVKKGLPQDEIDQMIDELNEVVFGITPERAFEIVASSMRTGNA